MKEKAHIFVRKPDMGKFISSGMLEDSGFAFVQYLTGVCGFHWYIRTLASIAQLAKLRSP